MTQNTQTPQKKRRDPEGLIAIALIFTVLFEIFLTVVLLVRSFSGVAPIEPPSNPSTPPTGDYEPIVYRPLYVDNTADLSDDPSVKSKYVLLMNADTWEVVAQKNSDLRFSPASMTKVMTLLVACNRPTEADLEKKLVYSR